MAMLLLTRFLTPASTDPERPPRKKGSERRVMRCKDAGSRTVGGVPSRLVKYTTSRPPWQAATGGTRHAEAYQGSCGRAEIHFLDRLVVNCARTRRWSRSTTAGRANCAKGHHLRLGRAARGGGDLGNNPDLFGRGRFGGGLGESPH